MLEKRYAQQLLRFVRSKYPLFEFVKQQQPWLTYKKLRSQEFCGVNTTQPVTSITYGLLEILIKIQLINMFPSKSSLQLEGQSSEPKTFNRVVYRNWVSPKVSNTHLGAQALDLLPIKRSS